MNYPFNGPEKLAWFPVFDQVDDPDDEDAHPSLLTEELRDMVLGEVS